MYFLPSKNAEPEEIPDGDEIVLQKGQENGIRCQVQTHKNLCMRRYHMNMRTFKKTAVFHYVGCLYGNKDIASFIVQSSMTRLQLKQECLQSRTHHSLDNKIAVINYQKWQNLGH